MAAQPEPGLEQPARQARDTKWGPRPPRAPAPGREPPSRRASSATVAGRGYLLSTANREALRPEPPSSRATRSHALRAGGLRSLRAKFALLDLRAPNCSALIPVLRPGCPQRRPPQLLTLRASPGWLAVGEGASCFVAARCPCGGRGRPVRRHRPMLPARTCPALGAEEPRSPALPLPPCGSAPRRA